MPSLHYTIPILIAEALNENQTLFTLE